MNQTTLILSPEKAHDMEQKFRVVKRSIDARQKQLKVHLTVLTDEQGAPLPKDAPIPLYEPPHFQDVHNVEHSVAIIGAGPAGLFAALTLIEKVSSLSSTNAAKRWPSARRTLLSSTVTKD